MELLLSESLLSELWLMIHGAVGNTVISDLYMELLLKDGYGVVANHRVVEAPTFTQEHPRTMCFLTSAATPLEQPFAGTAASFSGTCFVGPLRLFLVFKARCSTLFKAGALNQT